MAPHSGQSSQLLFDTNDEMLSFFQQRQEARWSGKLSTFRTRGNPLAVYTEPDNHKLDGRKDMVPTMNLNMALAKMSYIRSGVKEVVRILRREPPPIIRREFDLNELPRLLRKDNPIILDIGCNDGSQSLEFLKLFKDSKVYAFEPDPRAQDRFRHTVEDNRVKLFEMAVSSIDGETDFHMSNGAPSPDWKERLQRGWGPVWLNKKSQKAPQSVPLVYF